MSELRYVYKYDILLLATDDYQYREISWVNSTSHKYGANRMNEVLVIQSKYWKSWILQVEYCNIEITCDNEFKVLS